MISEPGSPVRLNLPDALVPVARLILPRPDLQAQLGELRDPDRFAAAIRELAAENGIAIEESDLRAALRPDPLGLGRFAAAPVEADCWPGPGWLPARSVRTGAEPAFDWLWFGPGKLTAPFFEDEVRRAESLPLNWLLRTRLPMAALVAGAAGVDAPPTRGLIFHMSRCGSTLLAQMLGAIAQTAVTSEPEPFDAVLRWIAASRPPADAASAAIRAMAAALGRRTGVSVNAHVIKLEVWHTFFLPELRAALPEAAWTYLHRDPVEVLVSQLAQPSMHVIPGALDEERTGIRGFDAVSHLDYTARVLGRCVAAAVEHWSLGGGMQLDYRQIPTRGALAAAQHFALSPQPPDRAAMTAVTSRDAKAPETAFSSDIASKQAAASPEIQAAAEKWIDLSYRTIAEQ